MCEQLKTLSASQLEHLIKKGIDSYLGEEYIYIIKDLNSPYVNSIEQKITFKVEIECAEVASH